MLSAISFSLRRTSSEDAAAIHSLISHSKVVFPNDLCPSETTTLSDVHRELELSVFSIVADSTADATALYEGNNEPPEGIVAYFALSVHPAYARYDDDFRRECRRAGWDKLLRKGFQFGREAGVDRLNSLFLSRFATSAESAAEQGALLQGCLEMSFAVSPRLRHVIMMAPPAAPLVPPFTAQINLRRDFRRPDQPADPIDGPKDAPPLFAEVTPEGAHSLHQTCTVFWSRRVQVYPDLKVRKARVEDCDDLVPLFKNFNMLPPDAGDYHVAEILESHNPDVLSLVAEYRGTAIGFISVSTNVNLDELANQFALEPYSDLWDTEVSTEETTDFATTASVHRSSINLAAEKQGDEAESPEDREGMPVAATEETGHHGSVENLLQDIKAPNAIRHLTSAHNAFCVTLFCMDDRFAPHSTELIKPIFDSLEGRDYCFLSQPTTCREIALLAAGCGSSCFTRIPSLPHKQPRQCLYMAHRYGMRDRVRVRPGSGAADKESVIEFSQNPDLAAMLDENCEDEYETQRQQGRAFFVVEAYQQLVGYAVLAYQPVDDLLREFDAEHWISPEWHDTRLKLNVIEQFAINPLFEGHARWVLQELMALAETSILLFECSRIKDALSSTVLRSEMVPMRPCRIKGAKSHSAVWMVSLNMLTESRLMVNSRIVFVGASDSNLSTLAELIFDDHYCYNNLTLIAPEGYSTPASLACLRQIQRADAVGYGLNVGVVRDNVVTISREDKRVRLKRGGWVKYDQLVLGPGRQFTAPIEVALHSPSVVPFDIAHLHRLTNAKQKHPEGVVVIGSHISSFHAVTALLETRYPPKRIVHIVGERSNWHLAGISAERIAACYKSCGVRLVESLHVKLVRGPSDLVVGAQMDDGEAFPCSLVVLAHEKQVTPMSFRMVHDASLVYDQGIIISSNFGTCDPFILASGSATRFSRREGIPWTLSEVNPVEVGTKLAQVLTGRVLEESQAPEPATLHKYTQPVVHSAKIAGAMHFLHFDTPAPFKPKPDPTAAADESVDNQLTTQTDSPYTFIRLVLDARGRIETFYYLGERPVDRDMMTALYGLHERYLSRLCDRMRDGLIDDLYDYLMLPQFAPVYHDRFHTIMAHARDFAMKSGEPWVDELESLAQAKRMITEEERQDLRQNFEVQQGPSRKYLDHVLHDLIKVAK